MGLTNSSQVGWNPQESFHGKEKHTLAGEVRMFEIDCGKRRKRREQSKSITPDGKQLAYVGSSEPTLCLVSCNKSDEKKWGPFTEGPGSLLFKPEVLNGF